MRNLITYASFVAGGEALALADAAGIDTLALGEVVRHSDRVTGGPGAVLVRSSGAPLAPEDGLYEIFRHALDLANKDLDHALDLGRGFGVATPVAALSRASIAAALGIGADEADTGRDTDRDDERRDDGRDDERRDDGRGSVRARGRAKMREVYGWDIDPVRPYEVDTVDVVFGHAWQGDALSARDRRLMLIGMMIATGMADLAVLQMEAALAGGELDEVQLREAVRFMSYYAGWPRTGRVHMDMETMLARRAAGGAH